MDRLFFETKLAASDAGEISGVAWPFGKPDRIGDVIEKGAFKNVSLPLPMLFGHDLNDPIGTWTSAVEDADGFKVSGNLLVGQVKRADEIFALVKSGAVRGLSVGFRSKKAAPRKGGGRTISDLELLEVSLVTIGMNPGARVTSAKSSVLALRLAESLNRAASALAKG
ncbi:HK97 family phage prohead protease [Gellertiella hungarica]|uniref:HK97 family phage prohead protease n=1 Tax=Gellertiella hungarica TaxID=1572859 RepID=A0A7W6J4Q2_9HYPH|nr:HK97 family phage prohead protease [Gellertiella hungarica]MBB4064740.1 HK97 family phage prohead protease [Gellertiella hungarica]